MWLKLAWRELKGNRWFTILFVTNLAIGLLGFVTLDGFKRNLDHALQDASRNLLTADITVSARRELTPEERRTASRVVGEGATSNQRYTLYSMAASAKRSSLVEIRAVDDSYPFYGWLALRNGGRITSTAGSAIHREPAIWVFPEVLAQLDVAIGDKVKLGGREFTVADVIDDDSAASWSGASYAPRAYVGMSELMKTGLITRGSTFWHALAFKLPPEADVRAIEKRLDKALDTPGVNVTSHLNADENNARLVGYINDYLGLVAIVAFFLSGLGTAYLFRSYLARKHREIAILLSLGYTHGQATRLYMTQISLVGLIAALAASVLAFVALPFAVDVIASFTPVTLNATLSPASVLVALALGTIGSQLICLPLIMRIRELKPASLFQEFHAPSLDFSLRSYLAALPTVAAFYFLAVWQSQSWVVGSLFFGAMAASAVVLGAAGWAFLKGLEALEVKRPLSRKLATRYLTRNKVSALACFLAMSLGALLINLIPQIRSSLESELERPTGSKLPSLFLFDVQEEQAEPLKALLARRSAPPRHVSPMIRGRLTSINGAKYEKPGDEEGFSREDQQAARFRNRGINLSYRDELAKSEEIVTGRPFSGRYDVDKGGPIELSVEERYADRMGLAIGDRVSFEVQSIPMEGVIVNLRKVHWNSFDPNFFIQVQPGSLDDAPKTFIASLPPLDEEAKYALQNDLVEAFPNVSIIDVTRLIQKILDIVEQMSWVLTLMAILSLAAGVVVLFSIAHHQVQARAWDTNLLKILGAGFHSIKAAVYFEFGLIGALAAVMGAAVGIVVSYLIAAVIFESIWSFDWRMPLITTASVVGLSLATASLATRRVLRRKPHLYLNRL